MGEGKERQETERGREDSREKEKKEETIYRGTKKFFKNSGT